MKIEDIQFNITSFYEIKIMLASYNLNLYRHKIIKTMSKK